MSKVIGIDLGTTNSVVAVLENGTPAVIINEEGARLTPSVVAYTEKGETLVGAPARRQQIVNPTSTVASVKRLMGRRYAEVGAGAGAAGKAPYKIVETLNGGLAIEIHGKKHTAPEISAAILQKLKRAAEAYTGSVVTEAVVTVPAYFNDAQRQATKDAGKIAGLDVKRIVNEPTAAALAYGLDKKKDELIAVYDFGGGTFDVSILEVAENVIEVVSTNGDTQLGGDDVDERIVDLFVATFKTQTGLDVSGAKLVMQRLRDAAEKAKIELSTAVTTEVNLPFLTADATGPKHFTCDLSRAKLESLIEDLIARSFDACRKALADAKKTVGDINEVVLVGGSTRIPRVQAEVEKFFGKAPNKSVNPDEVVAIGAAVQAGILTGDVKDIVLLDVTPLSLGVATLGGVMTRLIERNTTIPASRSEVFSTAADNQASVEVIVLQGEREFVKDNRLLGRFVLDGIPPAPRAVPRIEVTFDIDVNGILSVKAVDKATGRVQHITIKSPGGLTDAEIKAAVKDAETNAADDKARREVLNAKHKLTALVLAADKALRSLPTMVDTSAARSALDAAKTVVDKPDASVDDAETARTALEEASHALAQAAYAEQPPASEAVVDIPTSTSDGAAP